MRRYDYMQKCVDEIKQLAEDALLTHTMECFLMLATGNVKDLVSKLNEIMQKYDKSIKIFNFIGVAMMAKGQPEKAIKVYEKLIQDLKLKDEVKCKEYIGNVDIVDMLANYLTALRWMEIDNPQITACSK